MYTLDIVVSNEPIPHKHTHKNTEEKLQMSAAAITYYIPMCWIEQLVVQI